MFGWREKRGTRERVDLLSSELFEAMRASEEEIDETALSPDLLSRVQGRIASRRRRIEIGPSVQSPGYTRGYKSYLAWATVAAAVLLALTFAARLTRTHRTNTAPQEIVEVSRSAISGPPATADQPAAQPAAQPEAQPAAQPAEETVSPKPASLPLLRTETGRKTRHPRARTSDTAMAALMSEEQQATEFLPLTLIPEEPEERAGENHQIVRVTLPRTTLLAFGVPMNMEHAGELVTADVMLGADGVAHAIRFVH
jgi:hypothetical protein